MRVGAGAKAAAFGAIRSTDKARNIFIVKLI